MSFYFSFCRHEHENSLFFSKANNVPILEAKMFHGEGKPAELTLTLWSASMPEDAGPLGCVWQKNQSPQGICLFFGTRLSSAKLSDGKVTLRFLGRLDFSDAPEIALTERLKQDLGASYHPLLHKPEDGLDGVLAGCCDVKYWNRKTASLDLSSLIRGGKVYDVSAFVNQNTTCAQDATLKELILTSSVQFLQSYEGTRDLGPDVQDAFPGKKVTTFTPNSFKSGGLSLPGQSGYSLMSRTLSCQDGGLEVQKGHPEDDAPGQPRDPKLASKEYVFNDLELRIGYIFRQKRQESIRLLFPVASQNHGGIAKQVEVKIQSPAPQSAPEFFPHRFYPVGSIIQRQSRRYQAVEAHASATFIGEKWQDVGEMIFSDFRPSYSFFKQDIGKAVLRALLARGQRILAMHHRDVSLTLWGPRTSLASITLDDMAFVSSLYPWKGEIKTHQKQKNLDPEEDAARKKGFFGKITAITWEFHGTQGLDRISFSMAGSAHIGVKGESEDQKHPENFSEIAFMPDYAHVGYEEGQDTPISYDGMTLSPFFHQIPRDPLDDLAVGKSEMLLQNILVHNPGTKQRELLRTIDWKTLKEDGQFATQVFIALLPLKGEETETCTIDVTLSAPCTPPRAQPKLDASWSILRP